MSLSPTAKSAQDAARQTTGEFGTQTHTESGIVPFLSNPAYVHISRPNDDDLYIGPYADEVAAGFALRDWPKITGFLVDGARGRVVSAASLPPHVGLGVGETAPSSVMLWASDTRDSEPAPVTPDQVVDHMTGLSYPLSMFEGYDGDRFRHEVSSVALAIADLEKGRDGELVYRGDDEYSTDEVGFIWHGFTVTKHVRIDEMVSDKDADGKDAVRAIATTLMATRDKMLTDFKASLSTH